MAEYLVVYEQTTAGWSAYVPDLPGLGVTGDTLEEVKQMISEGVVFHIKGLQENGDPVPKPVSRSSYVTVG